MNRLKNKGIFITGTDTGVGKTLVAGAIANILTQKGKRVGVFKPVSTGCKKTKNGLISQDGEFLAYCAKSKFAFDLINPVKFKIPAAPLACEKAENKKVDLKKIAAAFRQICQKSDFVIVEGIGGIKCPITKNIDVLGLAKMFNLPVVIVARAKLGTINHTLLTVDAIRSAGLLLAAVIINGYDEKTKDYAQKTNADIIKKLGKIKNIAVVPFDPAPLNIKNMNKKRCGVDKKTNMKPVRNRASKMPTGCQRQPVSNGLKKFKIGRKIIKPLEKIDWMKIK